MGAVRAFTWAFERFGIMANEYLAGFIRFLEGYYIILITKRSAVALIGGHYIYHIDDTMLISVPGPGAKLERKPDEAR